MLRSCGKLCVSSRSGGMVGGMVEVLPRACRKVISQPTCYVLNATGWYTMNPTLPISS